MSHGPPGSLAGCKADVLSIARLTPHAFHGWVVRWRGRGRAADDVFPTRYRANSPAAIRRLAAGAGLEVVRIELIEGRPEYLRFSAPT